MPSVLQLSTVHVSLSSHDASVQLRHSGRSVRGVCVVVVAVRRDLGAASGLTRRRAARAALERIPADAGRAGRIGNRVLAEVRIEVARDLVEASAV